MTPPPPLVEVHVDERLLGAVVTVRRGGGQIGRDRRIGLVDQRRLGAIDLLHADAGPQIAGMDVLREIALDLRVAVQEPEEVVAVTGGKVAELVPWEAFDLLMDDERSEYERRRRLFAPVRRPVAPANPILVPDYAPVRFDEPMRVAVVFGHPDGAFDSAGQQMRVRDALGGLSAASAGRIAPPTENSILDLASQPSERWKESCIEDPNVVLFFGQGRGGDEPAIRAGPGPGGWLPLQRLIDIVRGRRTPPFWAFLACSLGEAAPRPLVLAGPRAFTILRDQGAVAMLAMRAKVRPLIADMMIRALIESMSVGYSMEVAAAHGRRAIRDFKRSNGLVDWAAPAVWSVAGPASGYVWGGVSRDPAAFIGLQLLRTTANDPGLGLEDPTPEALARSDRWHEARRVRLSAGAGWTPETRAGVAAVLAAARRQRGSTVVLVDLPRGASYSTRLKDWAAGFRETLTPAFAGSALVRALHLLEDADPDGLRVLLAIPDVMVAFSEPPAYGTSDEVVWERIEGAPPDAVIAFCERPGGALADRLDGWALDQIGRPYEQASVDTLFATAPAAMALLSIVERPISLEVLGAVTGQDASGVADPQIVISEPASGVVLIDAARERIAKLAGPDRLLAAHRSYLRADSGALAAFRRRGDWTELIRHLIGAGLKPELVAFVRDLVQQDAGSWLDSDWMRLEAALETAGDARRGIADGIVLQIAAVLLDRQEMERARSWLEPLSCRSELDESRRLAMLSEAWKAQGGEGGKRKMWEALRAALAACEAAPQDSATEAAHREYEMSLARLELYFHHDASAARVTFERLIALWRAELPERPEVARPLAAALRNLAECLFEFEPFAGLPESWPAAEALLDEASELTERRALAGVDAEVAYSMAKLMEVRTDGAGWSGEAVSYLRRCAELAKTARHHVLLRIAQLRLFRLQVRLGDRAFDAEVFRSFVQPLEYLGWHAWAARYAGQARLWATRRLAEGGDVAGAIGLLRRNVLALAGQHALDGTSDRANLARTFAGLALLQPAGGHWAEFQRIEWAPSWLEEHGRPSLEGIWSEVA